MTYGTQKTKRLDELEDKMRKLFIQAYSKNEKNEAYMIFMNKLNNNKISIGAETFTYDSVMKDTENLSINKLNDFARITTYLIHSRYKSAGQYNITNWFDCKDIVFGDRIKNYVLRQLK